MSDDFQRSARPAKASDLQRGAALVTPDPRQALEKATRMHLLCRARARHFLTPVMNDGTMGAMLSLYVGELQETRVSCAALAAANLLNRQEADALVSRLVQAGLVVLTGDEPEGRSVGLTPLGSARMRSFISDYPDV